MKRSIDVRTILLAGLLAVGVPAVHAKSPAVTPPAYTVIGAYPSPPMGAGAGKLVVLRLPRARHHDFNFGKAGTPSGNSFYVAVDTRRHRVYIPSVAGMVTVMNLRSGRIERRFKSIPGGRVARLSPDHRWLFVLSARSLAAYSTRDGSLRYQVRAGGNALAFNHDGSRLYVGGNFEPSIADIDTATGQIERRIPIARSGDLVWARGWLFSADMKSGLMTAIDPRTNHIVPIQTAEVDPHFSYDRIGAAYAGFMQLSVGPHRNYVYAAGFSGHVLRFSVEHPAYVGQVKVSAGRRGLNQLSGLLVLPNGTEAITTVENRRESVLIDLHNGRVLLHLPKVISNRWVLAQ